MTEQEIFDTVLAHLREQGEASADSSGVCQYRGPDGTSCAVGCLIPDEMYHPVIEGLGAGDIMAGAASQEGDMVPVLTRIADHLGAEHLPLLEELQAAHDLDLFNRGITDWEGRMRSIAKHFGLAYTPA